MGIVIAWYRPHRRCHGGDNIKRPLRFAPKNKKSFDIKDEDGGWNHESNSTISMTSLSISCSEDDDGGCDEDCSSEEILSSASDEFVS